MSWTRGPALVILFYCLLHQSVLSLPRTDEEVYYDEDKHCGEECHGVVRITAFLAGGLALLFLINLADPTVAPGRHKRSSSDDGIKRLIFFITIPLDA